LLSGISILAFIFISLPANTTRIQNHGDNILDKKIHSEKAEKKDFDLKISKSIFEGLSSNLLPYKIIAETATKINDNLYDLQNIDAKYSLENGNLNIKAICGTLDDEAKSIILQNNVCINYGGAEINSEKIQFDLHNKNAQSDSKVHVQYKNSSLDADRFDTDDSSDIINLEGNVESLFKISDF
jgi:LPS export ABC transporter protein LptC